MKAQLPFIILLFLCNICFAQISFEKGYYIDNDNQRIDCLIKNNDWKNNPIEFKYKMSVDEEIKTAGLLTVKEFGVGEAYKYLRSTVSIDRTSEVAEELTKNKAPVFQQETLFLKVLETGEANLYEYLEGSLTRYFYDTANTEVQQLVFKSYIVRGYKIAKNNRFKQQLWNNLKCDQFDNSRIERLRYRKKDLVGYFKDYNKCEGTEMVSFEVKEKRDLFNLSIRPRGNSTTSTIQNSISSGRNTDFGSRVGFGLGLEAEFLFPFNKSKWAVTIEPTFQSFKAETVKEVTNLVGGKLVANIDYKSMELPLTIRHYFFLNQKSKLFLDFSYIYDFVSDSYVEFAREDGSVLETLAVNTRSNVGLGIGFKQNDRFSLQLKYYTNREILGKFVFWDTEYKTLSVILGYTLF